jgi:hypothetical protein
MGAVPGSWLYSYIPHCRVRPAASVTGCILRMKRLLFGVLGSNSSLVVELAQDIRVSRQSEHCPVNSSFRVWIEHHTRVVTQVIQHTMDKSFAHRPQSRQRRRDLFRGISGLQRSERPTLPVLFESCYDMSRAQKSPQGLCPAWPPDFPFQIRNSNRADAPSTNSLSTKSQQRIAP